MSNHPATNSHVGNKPATESPPKKPQPPIIAVWTDLLTNIKDKAERCAIQGSAWRVDNATVIAVEAEYVVLDSIDNSTPRRHFVALDSIAVISR